jgi:Ni,Fe-hydrogenase maturation factor
VAGSTPEKHLADLASREFDTIMFIDAIDFPAPPGSVALFDADGICARVLEDSTRRGSLGLLCRQLIDATRGTTQIWLLAIKPAAPGEHRTSVLVQMTCRIVAGLLGELLNAPTRARQTSGRVAQWPPPEMSSAYSDTRIAAF